jgi:hypothetical protein
METQDRQDGAEPDARTMRPAELAAYLDSKTTVSVPFAGAACGIARAASYRAAADGSLKALRVGHRLVVPARWLREILELRADT